MVCLMNIQKNDDLSFSSLKTALKDKIGDVFSSKIASKLESDEFKKLIHELFENFLPVQGSKKKLKLDVYDSTAEALGMPISARQWMKVDNISLLYKIYVTLEESMKEIDKLDEKEKAAIIRHLPFENLPQFIKDRISNKKWNMPTYMGVAVVGSSFLGFLSSMISSTGQVMTHVAKDATTQLIETVAPGFDKRIEGAVHAISEDSSLREVSTNVGKVWGEFTGTLDKLGVQAARKVVGNEELQSGVLDVLSHNMQFVNEVLDKTDETMKNIPPKKMIEAVLDSFDKFSEIAVSAKERFPKGILDNADTRYHFELYHAAAGNKLPSRIMNMAFEELCDPKKMDKPLDIHFSELIMDRAQHLAAAHPEEALQLKSSFQDYCTTMNLDQKTMNKESLELIEAAFLLKELSREEEGPVFLANILLTNPHLLDDREHLQLEAIFRQASIVHIKKEVYPTLVQKFLPSDFNELIHGLSHIKGVNEFIRKKGMVGKDLEDMLSTIIATEMIDKPTEMINPYKISLLFLEELKSDFRDLTETRLGDNSPQVVNKRFEDVFNSLGGPNIERALKRLNATVNPLPKGELQQQAVRTLKESTEQLISSTSIPKFILQPFTDLADHIVNLSNRKDKGICILLCIDNLNKVLKDPSSVHEIDLSSPRIDRILDNFYPSISGTLRRAAIKKGLQYGLSKVNLESLNYDKVVVRLKQKFLEMHVEDRLFNTVKKLTNSPESNQMLREGFKHGFKQHLEKAIKLAWGVEIDSPIGKQFKNEYLEYLNSLSDQTLVETVSLMVKEPLEFQRKLTAFKEEVLRAKILELNDILFKPTRADPPALQALQTEIKKLQESIQYLNKDLPQNVVIENLKKEIKVLDEQIVRCNENIDQTKASIKTLQKQSKQTSSESSAQPDTALIMTLGTLKNDLKGLTKRKTAKLQALKLVKKSKEVTGTNVNQNIISFKFDIKNLLKDLKIKIQLLIKKIVNGKNKAEEWEISQRINSLERQINKLEDELTKLEYAEYKTATPEVINKLEWLDLFVLEKELSIDPVKNHARLLNVRTSLKALYKKILEAEFKTKFEIQNLDAEIQETDRLDKSYHKALSSLGFEINRKSKRLEEISAGKLLRLTDLKEIKAKKRTEVRKTKKENASIEHDLNLLEREKGYLKDLGKIQEEKWELQDKLTLKQNEMDLYIQEKERTMPSVKRNVLRVKNIFFESDPRVIEFRQSIESLTKEIELVEQKYQKELVAGDPHLFEEARKRLKTRFEVENSELTTFEALYDQKLEYDKYNINSLDEKIEKITDEIVSFEHEEQDIRKEIDHNMKLFAQVEKVSKSNANKQFCLKRLSSLDQLIGKMAKRRSRSK